ncbi:MAG: GTPase Era [Oscillospiraceae bacterium]|nr:GTPase Era [Oscillospiraceae bacterium]
MTEKTSFIAIVGCPNTGKSSILNKLLGQKLAIVSPKPQTTRGRITGVLTFTQQDNPVSYQLVFTDTPGFHRPRTKLGEKMVKAVGDSISGVDACLLVVEPQGEIRSAELDLIDRFKKGRMKAFLAVNKIDTVKDKTRLMSRIDEFSKLYSFESVIPVSALKSDGIDILSEELKKTAVPSPHFFPDDALTDQPERVIAAEYIREKILLYLDSEVPHGTAVAIEKFKERENGILDIDCVIYCEKESHKGIIIGKNGGTLKKISSKARLDLEYFFDCKINLQCWVKVKEDWRNREGLIHNFGLS